jgi:hypothetical protein
MKSFSGAVLIILFVLQVFLPAGIVHARQAPPEKLINIFETFSELEGKFKAGKWDEALRITNGISFEFEELLPELQKTVRPDINKAFLDMLDNLRLALKEKDMEESEYRYISMQKLFFSLMDTYDYKVPPILIIIDKYILEAETALKKGDFRRVQSEMYEIGQFMFHADYILKEKGVSHRDIEEFKSTARDVSAAEGTKDVRAARQGLKKLKEMSRMFLKLFP